MASFADLPLGAKYRIVSAKARGQIYTKIKYRDHKAHADVFYAYADDAFQFFAPPADTAVVDRCQELELSVGDEKLVPRPVTEKLGIDAK